ncbi:hypothetical protein [Limnobacter sp.]|jgi:hypothetical protein|uniref:hypothetical protein n=1 Tax=Limnobacter sp. TaxID=2003368 RepID=UPI001E4D25FF|nr:hypothetical protein [Nostoc sp. CHAB 5844]
MSKANLIEEFRVVVLLRRQLAEHRLRKRNLAFQTAQRELGECEEQKIQVLEESASMLRERHKIFQQNTENHLKLSQFDAVGKQARDKRVAAIDSLAKAESLFYRTRHNKELAESRLKQRVKSELKLNKVLDCLGDDSE